jgi:hypothetical protein
MGRPSLYTPELADEICEQLMEGKSLVKACLPDSMPSRSTVLRWQNSNADFEAKCARARLMQADLMDDKILDLVDACDEHNYQSTRVKLAGLQWRAAKLSPKKYGDKTLHTGEDGEGPIQFTVTRAGSKEK